MGAMGAMGAIWGPMGENPPLESDSQIYIHAPERIKEAYEDDGFVKQNRTHPEPQL